MMEQSITTLMHSLSLNEDVFATLLKIKAFIIGSPLSSLKNIVLISNVENIFGCLETTNREQIEVTCYILNSLLPLLDPADVAIKLSSSLQNSLNHANPAVQLLALKQLNQIIATRQGSDALGESPEILRMAVKLIGNEHLSVASAAVQFLSDCGRQSPSMAQMLLGENQDSNLHQLKSVMLKSDEVRYRVFELACNIQSESQELLDLCAKSGILEQLFHDLSVNDVLLRVTCCAMLANMASSRHSLDYLYERGIVSCMTELLKNSAQEPLANLYVPGIVKFFGKLCLYNGPQKVLEMYPDYVDVLYGMLSEGDLNMQRLAIETIGVIGHSAEGKKLLAQQGKKTTVAMENICQIIRSGSQDVRISAVDTMSQLLDVSGIPDEEADSINVITLSWFRLISDDPIQSIIDLCKQPFPAVRCSAMHLLKIIAGCEWGLDALVDLSFLTEYLLDRSTETEKECKEAKFEVVQALCAAKRCAHVFGNQNYLKFRQFQNEGPFYVEAQMSVAVEEA